ncbi:hypothetical protein FRB93_005395 [Tulasnella sp. JGI-2019a]|nr:hypothetical protein FRB93_005395 [Tulasnella sp. JGI-2019a]
MTSFFPPCHVPFLRLPGFDLSNLLISARRDRSLFIAADKFDDERNRMRLGVSGGETSTPIACSGRFERLIRFGPDAQPSRASAHFDGERLTITVPKVSLNGWTQVDHPQRVPSAQVERSPRSVALSLKHAANAEEGVERLAEGERERCYSSASSARSSCDGSTLEDMSVYSPQTNLSDEEQEESRPSSSASASGSRSSAVRRKRCSTSEAMAGLTFSPKLPLTPPLPPSPTMSTKRPRSISPDPQDPGIAYHDHASSSAPMRRLTSRSPPASKQPAHQHPYHQHHALKHPTAPRHDTLGLSGLDSGRLGGKDHDDLETPTPWRITKERDGAAAVVTSTTSPKKDYFGLPLSTSSSSSSTATIRQSLPSSSRKAPLPQSDSVSMDVDVDETVIIGPPHMPRSATPPASGARTREQGMGRSAFFWKRWAPAGPAAY